MAKGFFSRIIADARRPVNMALANQNMQNHRMVESPVFSVSEKNLSKDDRQAKALEHVEPVVTNVNHLPSMDMPETRTKSQGQSQSVHITADASQQRKAEGQKELVGHHNKASIELDTLAKPVQANKRHSNSKKVGGAKDHMPKPLSLSPTPEVIDLAKRFVEPSRGQVADKTGDHYHQPIPAHQVRFDDKHQSNTMPESDIEDLQSANEGYVVVEPYVDEEGAMLERYDQDNRDSGLGNLVAAIDFPDNGQPKSPVESQERISSPQVSIGRIDVVVVASQSKTQQPQVSSSNGFSSRNYLRKL